ncbi:hypothetical protein Q9L58_006343 [Maublancomyces gigas]|uniref:SCP domain-containing protein n=1 Tax=Discina gigas TaxID=1032678 RepID=A0ABR3GFL7_9PEZI
MQSSWKITPFLLLLLLSLILSTFSLPLESRLLGIVHNPAVPKVENHDDHFFLDDNAFRDTMLHEHNALRREHGVGQLTWDPVLANYAEAHAHKCEWGHSYGPYGENIAAHQNLGGAAWVATAWGPNERAKYDYGPGPHPIELMHFTQMVWRGSERVGCARKKCLGMNVFAPEFQPWYTVCEYFPPGNYPGQFVQNVPRPV